MKNASTLALLALLSAVPAAAEIQATGTEVLVNADQSFKQRRPVSLYHADGSFTSFWENDQLGIRARRFAANGQPIGPDMALAPNQTLPSLPSVGAVLYNSQPAALNLPNRAGYLVFWTEERSTMHLAPFHEWREVQSRHIVGQRFTAAGLPVGDRFRVSTDARTLHSYPAASLSRRQVLVTWQTETADSTVSENTGVFARLIDLRGNALSGVVRVSAADGGTAKRPTVAANREGRYLVAWEGCCGDGSSLGVFARLVNSDASPLNAPFLVNTTRDGGQARASIAADQANQFLILWQGRFQTAGDTRIFGQLMDRDGRFLGAEIQISSGEQGGNAQVAPSVAAKPNGGFIALWLDYNEIFPLAVWARELDASGNAASDERQLSTRRPYAQYKTSIETDGRGHFLSAWEGSHGEEIGVTLIRFTVAGQDTPRQGGLEIAD